MMGFLEIFGFLAKMSWLPALCFLAGFILVIFEMFYPGFGVAGISGSVLLFLGVLFMANTLIEAVILLLIIFAILGAMLTFVLHSASRGRLSKMILSSKESRDLGYVGTEDLDYFLNKEGVSASILRPSGTADFNGVKLDVVTQGEFLQKGTPIEVIKVEGRRIVVKEIV